MKFQTPILAFGRLSTRWQFFLAIAGTGLILTVLILAGMRSYFIHNFTNYLAEQERQRLTQVALVLGDYHESHTRQIAARAVSSEQIWRQVMRQIQNDVLFNPGRLNLDPQLSFTQLALYTPEGERLFGPDIFESVSVPVVSHDQVVAILRAPRPEGPLQPVDAVFQEQQVTAYVIAGLLALLLASLSAGILTYGLRARLRQVKDASHRLASGHYETRIQVGGRDDIHALAEDFNALAESLERGESRRRQLLADVAHELRTPLTVLRGDLEAVQDGVRPFDQRHQDRLYRQVLHLARLTDDLHQLAQADVGQLAYNLEPVDLSELTQDLAATYASGFRDAQLQFTTAITTDSCTVAIDRDRWRQALGNLLNNSLRYTDAEGRVELRLQIQQGLARWELEDSAPGLTEAECARLGERLYRPDMARTRESGGSGLGLAIAQSIISHHGGKLSFEPSAWGGILARIELELE
ncbi:MAG: HAMP domain-containing protein [Idiomarina sp.]|nr:HAMP domain-containing protein [Idiomarina sp.]